MQVSGQPYIPAILPQENDLPVPIEYEAERASQPVWTLWSRVKCLAPAGIGALAVQPVACPASRSADHIFAVNLMELCKVKCADKPDEQGFWFALLYTHTKGLYCLYRSN
jgi:hypothetical protein